MNDVKRAIIVFVHGKAAPAFQRHYFGWLKHARHIFTVSPVDDPMPKGWLTVGKSEHSGYNAILRPRMALEKALKLPFDEYVFLEYDCLILNKLPPVPDGVVSSVFEDATAAQNGFKTPYFFHSPWWMSRQTLEALQPFLSMESLERGYPDRWMAWVTCRAVQAGKTTIQIANAYSRDTINHPTFMAQAREARKKGVNFIHGIKTEEQLRDLLAP